MWPIFLSPSPLQLMPLAPERQRVGGVQIVTPGHRLGTTVLAPRLSPSRPPPRSRSSGSLLSAGALKFRAGAGPEQPGHHAAETEKVKSTETRRHCADVRATKTLSSRTPGVNGDRAGSVPTPGGGVSLAVTVWGARAGACAVLVSTWGPAASAAVAVMLPGDSQFPSVASALVPVL